MDHVFFVVTTDGCGNLIAADTDGQWRVIVPVLDTENGEVTKADFVKLAQLAFNAMEEAQA